jgi:hypothetical protein
MEFKHFMLVIFICSLFLIVPTIVPQEEINLAPNQTQSILLVVEGTTLIIETTVTAPLSLSVIYFDKNEGNITLVDNQQFQQFIEIETKNQGIYYIEIFSGTVGRVMIKQSGIPVINLTIVVIFGVLTFFVWSYKFIKLRL